MLKKIGAILFAMIVPFSHAETVNFSGTVTTSCEFYDSGVGVVDATGGNGIYRLSTMYGAGRPATIDFNYQGSPTLTLAAIQNFQYSGQGVAPAHSVYTEASFSNPNNELIAVANGFHGFDSGTKTMQMSGTTNTDRMFINLVATASSSFPIGDYSANTVVTCQ